MIKITDDLHAKIESVLFSSGRKMHVDEIAKLCKSSADSVNKALAELKKHYDENKSSLMLVEEGSMWKLTVREKFLPLVQKIVTETELPKSVIETLAVIAFKHPILQSELVKIRSNKAYEHLAELEDAGYIVREKHGRTKKIKLAQKFFEYFDLLPEKMQEAFTGFEAVERAIIEKEKELVKKKLGEEKKGRIGEFEVYESKTQEEVKAAVSEQPTLKKEEIFEEKPLSEEEAAEVSEKPDEGEEISPEEKTEEEEKSYVEEEKGEELEKSEVETEEPKTEEETYEPSEVETEEETETFRTKKSEDIYDLFKAEEPQESRKKGNEEQNREHGQGNGISFFIRGTKRAKESVESMAKPQKVQAQEPEPTEVTAEDLAKDPEKMIEKIIEKKANAIINPPKEEKKPKEEEQHGILNEIYDEIEQEKEELEKKTR